MTQIPVLLELRNRIKRRKPDFIRQDAHKVKKLERKWRKPKGIHSKMRHKFKGYRKLVSKGHKSPAKVRGLSGRGMEMILVANLNDLQKINAKSQVAIIMKTVGLRKRLAIVDKANEMNIQIVNIKNQKDFKAEVAEQKKRKLENKQESVDKDEKAEKLATEKKKSVEKESKDKDALQEKKELDKLLTRPE